MEPMLIQINPGGELPIYRQIMRQISDLVAGSHLERGQKLLSHRDLAAQLVIAPLTVKKAYDELEREGLLVTRRGLGTFVSTELPVLDPEEVQRRLREAGLRLLSQAQLNGVPFEQVLSLLDEIRNGMKS